MTEASRFVAAFSLRRNLKQLLERPENHVSALDGIRGFGILWITGCHAIWLAPYVIGAQLRIDDLPSYLRFFNHADLGVDAFFVLSGFLIGRMLLAAATSGNLNLKAFYTARAFRILPVYCACLLIWSAIGAPNRDTIWANLLFVNNWLPLPRQALPTAWSLAIEEQFYLIMPLVAMGLARLRPRNALAVLLALLAASFLARWAVVVWNGLPLMELHDYMTDPPASMDVMYTYHDTLYDKLHVRFGCLVAGVIAAHLHLSYGQQLRRLFESRYASLALVLPASLFAFLLCSPRTLMHVVALRGVLGIVVAVAVLNGFYPKRILGRCTRWVLSLRIWYPFAQLSYAAYLVQLMVISIYYGVRAQNNSLPIAELVLQSILPVYLATFAIAALLYLGVERPLLNLRPRLNEKPAPGGSLASSVADRSRRSPALL